MTDDLASLLARMRTATGSDPELDQALTRTLKAKPAAYSASVDACLVLLHELLPDWHWHVGYGASGILPYASLVRGEIRREASAPTVPLALLSVLVQAMMAEQATTS